MNIVIADMYYHKKHKELNIRIINALNKFASLTIINKSNYYDKEELPDNDVKILKSWHKLPNRIDILRNFLTFIHIVNLSIKLKFQKDKYDHIIFLSNNHIALHYAIKFHILKAETISVFHHYEIDRIISSKNETRLYQKYMNRYKHLVFADFIKNGIVDKLGTDSRNVIVVPHPIIGIDQSITKINHKKGNIIIGIGRNNDPKFLTSLLSLDEKSNFKNRYFIRLRSNELRAQTQNVEIFQSNYIEDKEYAKLLNDATACVVLYDESYKLRYSGVIISALSHGTRVICNDIPIAHHFKKKCPNNCEIIKTPEELYQLSKHPMREFDNNEFNNYIMENSDDVISLILKHIYDRKC